MGKKSKRNKDNDKSRKERLRERRGGERQSQEGESKGESSSECSESKEWDSIYVGDRIWFSPKKNETEWRRGVVKAIGDTVLTLLPLEAEDREDLYVKVSSQWVEKDNLNWTLRFQVGDKVATYTNGGWVPATVVQLFPTPSDERHFDSYQCRMGCISEGDSRGYQVVSLDIDNLIVKRPNTFRFSMGDEVIFASNLSPNPAKNSLQPWIQGTITGVDVSYRRDFYAAYKVSFKDRNKPNSCYIAKDNDQHVARPNSQPRHRLLEAIEQDCDYKHIDYLIKFYNLEVTAIADMLLSKAIASCSYDMLLWLQENTSVDLRKIRDVEQNGLLHQIARNPCAERFFWKAGYSDRFSEFKRKSGHYIELGVRHLDDEVLILQINSQGQSWLHELVISGNIRTLDIILSPKGGLAWELSRWLRSKRHNVENLIQDICKTARHLGQYKMEKMIDEFYGFHLLHVLSLQLDCQFISSYQFTVPSSEALSQFGKENASSVAKRLLRFYHLWINKSSGVASIENAIAGLCQQGNVSALSWLTDEDPSLLNSSSAVCVPLDKNEFSQPELYDRKDSRKYEELNLVSLAVVGNYFVRDFNEHSRHSYSRMLKQIVERLKHATDEDEKQNNFLHILIYFIQSRMEGEKNGHKDDFHELLKYKLYLLNDDESLENRLKVLSYLVNFLGCEPPNVLDVIRWRKCRVLQWLVTECTCRVETNYLHVKVYTDPDLIHRGQFMEVLGGGKIPVSMTVGVLLCLAAIEFDDLLSFQWLVDAKEIPVTAIQFDGWNVLHCCAFFGRSEIFLWLQSKNMIQPFVKEKCTRKLWKGQCATHIAVKRGFTFLADLLLLSGSPSLDSRGKSVYYYASCSKLEFVREWGKMHEKTMRLEQDIFQLIGLLSSMNYPLDDIKCFISSTKCMDPLKWFDCNFTAHKPGPLGNTYLQLLAECCKITEPDYVAWLFRELSPTASKKTGTLALFWGVCHFSVIQKDAESLDVTALQAFAVKSADEVLKRCLGLSWNKNIACQEPCSLYPILGELFKIFHFNAKVMSALEFERDRLLRIDILNQAMIATMNEIAILFMCGSGTKEVSNCINLALEIACKLAVEENHNLASCFENWQIISFDGKINLDYLMRYENHEKHLLQHTICWYFEPSSELSKLYVVLVMEGYSELILWSFDRRRSFWNAKTEISVVRIAAFLGRMSIVEIFCHNHTNSNELFSEKASRFHAAILGAAEAGRIADMILYLEECKKLGLPLDVIFSNLDSITTLKHDEKELWKGKISSSLVCSVIFAFLNYPAKLQTGESQTSEEYQSVLKWIITNSVAGIGSIVHVTALILQQSYYIYCFEQCIDLLTYLVYDLNLSVFSCHEDINQISKQFCEFMFFEARDKQTDIMVCQAVFTRWLKFAVDLSFDIQSLSVTYRSQNVDLILETLVACQGEQRLIWSQFDLLKENRPLEEIKCAVENGEICLNGRYKKGLLFSHMAAAYDRLDLLQWLVEVKGMSLKSQDALGRTVADAAKASNASSTVEWISRCEAGKKFFCFASSHFLGKRALKQWINLCRFVLTIQSWQRGNAVKKVYRGRVVSRLDERMHFQEIWGRSISMLASTLSLSTGYSWRALKQQEHDIMLAKDLVDDIDKLSETAEMLGDAAAITLSNENLSSIEREEDDFDSGQVIECMEDQSSIPTWQYDGNLFCIKFTSYVVKWLLQGDRKHREFFVRRIQQLASGERSRILSKRLTGSKRTIFETYLEQKSGYRILWTAEKDQSLLIWYVAKHKDVSRLMSLINDAENRSSRQHVSSSILSDHDEIRGHDVKDVTKEEQILLDPLGDTPLKLYEVSPCEIGKLTNPSWKPRLYLTKRERDIVETSGTVLLLGRSGTGKTCTICNRMDYDRQRAEADPGFSQLFIARSKGLCDYVRNAVTISNSGEKSLSAKSMSFETFGQLIGSLERQLPLVGKSVDPFLPSRRMDFGRFKREVCRPDSSGDLDALTIWTNIRSFIKGSIEALQHHDGVLTEKEYFDLGKRRCRLSLEQRQCVYAVFESYIKYNKAMGLWDDCDRIMALARRLEYARRSDPDAYEGARYNKLYVDEVQDYTQAEIAIFFYLCGPGDLFLAGDPAQSVVEGVEFRFEEIRSVGYCLYGDKQRHLIPEKPKTVHLNFRSHRGILNVAAAILSCMFEVSPDSVKQLEEDQGLFQGPRPGLFYCVGVAQLHELVMKRKGIVVLTHDHDVSRLKHSLDYPLVYGIREAKGLEFKEVILVDFFGGMPDALQKPWRNLFLGRDVAGVRRYPEIESQLKLLYTAVTRCIQCLFFAETSSSIAGNAFVRWLTTTMTSSTCGMRQRKEALAVKSSVENVEKMVRTHDEWRSAGLDNAVMAESSEELSKSVSCLDKAIYCFKQVGDTALTRKAHTHLWSIQLRLNLANMADGANETLDAAEIELDAALLTEKLLAESLLLEAKKVCCAILHFLTVNSQNMLQDELISLLPDGL